MRTNVPHIFAVGDVNGLHEIVHIAIEQGEIAAHNATQEECTSIRRKIKTQHNLHRSTCGERRSIRKRMPEVKHSLSKGNVSF